MDTMMNVLMYLCGTYLIIFVLLCIAGIIESILKCIKSPRVDGSVDCKCECKCK